MNVDRQIEHWINSCNEDMKIAELLFKEKHVIHCLFYCHLSIEKILKTHITKVTQKTLPYIHNLITLAEKGNIVLDEATKNFFALLNNFQLEGRYHDEVYVRPDMEKTTVYFQTTKEKIEWLKKKL